MGDQASRMTRSLAARCAVIAALFASPLAHAEPRTPVSDDEVLEMVRPSGGAAQEDEFKRMQDELAWNRLKPEPVEKFVRLCFERLRSEGDPRYLGYAEGALTPWLATNTPPPGIWHLRATLKQSMHQFNEAMADLEALLKAHPDHIPAQLTRAMVLQVTGKFPEARRAAMQVATRTPGLLGITAAASVTALTGDSAKAMDLLEDELRKPGEPAERLWALTVLAETAMRTGQLPRAAETLDRAQGTGLRDIYLMTVIADFFLDANHPEDVIQMLAGETRVDSLLLRLALAEKAVEPPATALETHKAALRARFEAAAKRGDSMHQREEARFTLHLESNPVRALELAKANWNVQKEPADARILLESAVATRDTNTVEIVRAWMAETKLEDVHIAKLLASNPASGGAK